MLKLSKLFRLNRNDYAKGTLVAALTAVINFAFDSIGINAGDEVVTPIAAGIAYLIKNLFTNSSGKLFKKEEYFIDNTKDYNEN